MVFRYIFSFISTVLLLTCQDIPRDNLLDPKNPDSYSEPVVLAEAFVNTSNPYSYNQMALRALHSVAGQFSNRVLIVEYHRDINPGYPDPYSFKPGTVEPLYQKYVNQFTPLLKGVPDIFLNGTTARVQGAASQQDVEDRLNPAISSLITPRNYFTLEPGEVRLNNLTLTAECRVARMGREAAENILLKLIAVKNFHSDYLQRVVLDVRTGIALPRLEAGEVLLQKFDPFSLSEKPDAIVFVLSSADELIVHQSAEVKLE